MRALPRISRGWVPREGAMSRGLRAAPPGRSGSNNLSPRWPTAPATLTCWTWHCNTGLTRLAIKFPHLPPGTQVWLTACWFNTRFDPGPWSLPMTCHVGGGGTQSASAPAAA